MGLEDIAEGAKDDHEESETEDLKEDLGVESLEDLEELDDRLQRVMETSITHDKKIEELENELSILQGALSTALRQIDELKKSKSGDKKSESDDEPPSSEVKQRWQ